VEPREIVMGKAVEEPVLDAELAQAQAADTPDGELYKRQFSIKAGALDLDLVLDL
jgi:hypothetical protein